MKSLEIVPVGRRWSGLFVGAALSALAPGATGCAGTPEEEIGVAAEAAINPNAINPNALNPNAINPNAINPNALAPGALDPRTMDPASLRALADPGDAGDLSRELLRYTVGCAFSPAQSFHFSWTDAGGATHAESDVGLLGLAPYWATQPLDLAGQQWVSACLASRANAEGVSVMLSSRGTHPALATTPAERAAYRTREAVFFGNLFGDTPAVHACFDPLSILPSELAHRVCGQALAPDLADLSLRYDCGPIEVVGPCTQLVGLIGVGVCASQSPTDRYLYNCAPPGGAEVVPSITTFLRGSIPW